MAIESIRDFVFSLKSDVWSFGIVLWEFFTLAETPYPGLSTEKIYQRLAEGYRLQCPKFATAEMLVKFYLYTIDSHIKQIISEMTWLM